MAPVNPGVVRPSFVPIAFPEAVPPSKVVVGNGTAPAARPTTAPFVNRVIVFTASVAERVIAMCVQAPVEIGSEDCTSPAVLFGSTNLWIGGRGARMSACRMITWARFPFLSPCGDSAAAASRTSSRS